MNDSTIVSKYWTPAHRDVTGEPVAYARPKPTWLEGFQDVRERLQVTSDDRMHRRRLQDRSIVTEPADLGLCPSFVPAV